MSIDLSGVDLYGVDCSSYWNPRFLAAVKSYKNIQFAENQPLRYTIYPFMSRNVFEFYFFLRFFNLDLDWQTKNHAIFKSQIDATVRKSLHQNGLRENPKRLRKRWSVRKEA